MHMRSSSMALSAFVMVLGLCSMQHAHASSPPPASSLVTVPQGLQCGGYGGACGQPNNGQCVAAPWQGFLCEQGTVCNKVNVSYTWIQVACKHN